ncbi:MAG: leucine-rich repeat domain-containing protein, partial [Lachnospiraceae bacterium]|nr:leucine-rich repeat domain-containing protein [Lachnospiraceae bacterium]
MRRRTIVQIGLAAILAAMIGNSVPVIAETISENKLDAVDIDADTSDVTEDGFQYYISKTKGENGEEIETATITGYTGNKTEITVPSTVEDNVPVTVIRWQAFYNCSSLTSIEIPKGVESIEGSTFSGCSKLKEIKLPTTLKVIGYYAFRDCGGLISIEIPEGVESIGNGAFSGCS